VFMQEDVRVDDAGKVVLPAGLRPGAMCVPWARTFRKVRPRFRKACGCAPKTVALLAAFGLTQVDVRRRIRVAVFSTGDELVSPGSLRNSAQLFDSNRFMLMANAGAAWLRGQRSRYFARRSRRTGAGFEEGRRHP